MIGTGFAGGTSGTLMVERDWEFCDDVSKEAKVRDPDAAMFDEPSLGVVATGSG
jgi:hypothetical protein